MPELRLHGLPVLAADDARTTALSAREAALLAWLHLEGPTPRARVAGLLWPAGTESQARTNLRQLLARMRRGLGELIVETDGVLSLASAPVRTAEPSAALLAGMEFDDMPEFAQWLAERRDDLARRRQREALALGQSSLQRGDLDAALSAADALLAAQPESEEGWRLRMQALYQRGDRAAAIAAWDACKETLRLSFGLTPSAATNELGRLILASDELPAPASPGAVALPAALRRPPKVVGRDSLLAELGRALALGRSAVLSGPGGIGKSRVVQLAAAGMEPALVVQARPGDAVLAGGLLAQLLAAAVARFRPALDETTRRDLGRLLPRDDPALEQPVEPAAGALRSELEHRHAMTAVWRALSACQARGLRLLVIDDLHYVDDASLAVLHFVIGRWLVPGAEERTSALQVLLSARTLELSPAGQSLVGSVVGHSGGQLFEIQPLEVDHVHELVGRLPLPEATTRLWGPEGGQALAQALHAAVGGNPAFALEALRNLFLDGFSNWQPGAPLPVPATLRESVRRRLERLPEDALQLAQLAAVAQSDFDATLAAAAFGRSPLTMASQFAALEAAQVFQGAHFCNDLVAEAVRLSLPSALQVPLHGLVAEHLVRRGAAAARIAHHMLAAGQAQAAVPWQLQAARSALSRWLLPEAAAHFAAAARAMDPRSERAEALGAWCDALRCWLALQRFEDFDAAVQTAGALCQHTHELARVHARRVRQLFYRLRWPEATVLAGQLADELTVGFTAMDEDELVYALRPVCWAVYTGLPTERALELCDLLRPRLAAAGEAARAGFALACAEALTMAARPLEAAAMLEESWPALGPDSDPELRCALANQLMRVRHLLGDLSGATALGELLLELVDKTYEHAMYGDDALHFVGLLQLALGQPAKSLACFEALRNQPRRGQQAMSDVHGMAYALACYRVGLHGEARSLLAQFSGPLGRPGYALHDHIECLLQAQLAVSEGRNVQPWIDQLGALAPGPELVMLHRRVVMATLQASALDEVECLLDDLHGRGLKGMLVCAEMAAARIALDSGALEAAARHAGAALAKHDAMDPWIDVPAALWLTAFDVFSACGATDEAQRALADGIAWVERGSLQWVDPEHRRAWREGNPVHRALLERASAVPQASSSG